MAALSFQTVAELLKGAFTANWSEARVEQLTSEMRNYVVLPYDAAMAEIWARITVHRQRLGRELKAADAWIAATALWAAAPVITHNHRDFADIPDLAVFTEPDP